MAESFSKTIYQYKHQPTNYQPHQPTKYQAHQLPITNPYWLDHFPYQLPTSRFEFRILDPETSELFDLPLNVLVESTLQTPHDDVVSVCSMTFYRMYFILGTSCQTGCQEGF